MTVATGFARAALSVGKLLHSLRESDAAPKASHTAVTAKPTAGRVQPCSLREASRARQSGRRMFPSPPKCYWTGPA